MRGTASRAGPDFLAQRRQGADPAAHGACLTGGAPAVGYRTVRRWWPIRSGGARPRAVWGSRWLHRARIRPRRRRLPGVCGPLYPFRPHIRWVPAPPATRLFHDLGSLVFICGLNDPRSCSPHLRDTLPGAPGAPATPTHPAANWPPASQFPAIPPARVGELASGTLRADASVQDLRVVRIPRMWAPVPITIWPWVLARPVVALVERVSEEAANRACTRASAYTRASACTRASLCLTRCQRVEARVLQDSARPARRGSATAARSALGFGTLRSTS